MDRFQITSPYHIALVLSACMTLTYAIGDVAYMHGAAGGGMFVSDISYDAPDHAFIPFGSPGLGASPFGGGFVSSVDLGDTYFMPAAPMQAPMAQMAPARNVIQAFPSTRRSSYSRGITSRRYGGRRVRLYVV